MHTIVIYKSKYGCTKMYAAAIAKALSCEMADARTVRPDDLTAYDTVIYGGGLYAEIIAGLTLITKHFDKLEGKKCIVFTTGLTPISCTAYYENMVVPKNIKPALRDKIRVYHFPGALVQEELIPAHRAALAALKKIMKAKKAPTEMEKLLIELCDANGDFTDKNAIGELVAYAKGEK